MEPSEIKRVAATLGIVLPPKTRATTYIDHILGEAKISVTPTVEVQPVNHVHEIAPPTESLYDSNEIAAKVADILWERIAKAIANG